ncbi:hypothetical protein Avbf_12224 [Armadillidium vulgare]|nr:hypothetical protein Avbf_12224 [Armadillidium vulgare]
MENEETENEVNCSKENTEEQENALKNGSDTCDDSKKYSNAAVSNTETMEEEEEEKTTDGESESENEQDDNESGEEPESEVDHESGIEQDSGESEDHESGEDDNEGQTENDDDDHVSGEEQENEDDDDMSSKDSDSSAPNSPQDHLMDSVEKNTEDEYCTQNPSILEPTCELAESEDFEHGYKSRFNLRKRSHIQTSNEDFYSDEDNEPESGVPIKKLKFNFNKKTAFRRQRPYTNEAVKEAVKMVHSKKMSILEASRKFDIPRTSLHNFVRLYKRGRRIGVRTISPGLTKQEEDEMVSLVIKLSRCGKRYSHNELRYLIQYYLVNNDRPVFKSGTLPTMGWIAGLVERQPDLIKAKSKKNTKVAVEDVEEWQKQIEDYLINDWDLDIADIFKPENGHRIYCFNAFKMTLNGPAENAENKPSPVKKEPGAEEEKDQEMSVILGMSAAGGFVVPTVVLTEENQDICLDCDENNLRFLFNKTGRVDEDVAIRIVKEFDQEVNSKGIPKPVVFFVNDKQDLAHFSVIEYCWENQIVIICLPPKTCKTMTPFEVSIWPKIRSSYANLWKSAPKNYENKLTIDQFPELFLKAWESASIPKQAVRGFTKSGLIPLNVPSILGESSSTDQMSEEVQNQLLMQEALEDSISDELTSMEDRSRGKLEGIQMCLEAIESFIPPDVLPIWNERGADYRGRCELGFKLWRSVSLLLKAGCAMASIQQMADGFFNPFGSDFSSTASFFQKAPQSDSAPKSRSESPVVASTIEPAATPTPTPEKPVLKKRKLNKSIYSRSDASMVSGSGDGDINMKSKTNSDTPFVKVYQNPFVMQETGEEL